MTDNDQQLKKLKRTRTQERSKATRFTKEINEFTDSTPLEDLKHYHGRLQETLHTLLALDSDIQDLLSDSEFISDAEKCEEYTDSAKRALLRAETAINKSLSTSMSNLTVSQPSPTATTVTQSVKLPTIKLNPFTGNIEEWSRFWEQFSSSIDQNPAVAMIDKHVFLRGYLEGEPKNLVDGIAITAGTYEQTKKILHAKYGDKNRIIQAHLDFLENIPPLRSTTPESLNHTYVECNRRIQALRALGENIDNYGRILAPKILRAFPSDVCRRWIIHTRRESISEGDISKLMCFLNEEVEGALITQKIQGELPCTTTFPTTAAFQISTRTKKHDRQRHKPEPFCVFCDSREHWSQDCKKIIDVTDRKNLLKRANRCFLCLRRGHTISSCDKRGRAHCVLCRKTHHKSICDDDQKKTPAERLQPTSVAKVDVPTSRFTYLQTAQVRIIGPTGLSRLTRCVLDGGSQASFIARSLIDDLKLEHTHEQELTVRTFESQSNRSNLRRLVRFEMQGVQTNSKAAISAYECTHTLSPQPAIPQDVETWARTRKLQLADAKTESLEDIPVEILIGGDFYWKIVKDGSTTRLSSTAVLIPSIFGWILSGNRSGIHVNSAAVNFVNVDGTLLTSNTDLRRFWDLETLGITEHSERSLNAKDSTLLQEFQSSFRVENQRRVVSLPKMKNVVLADNRRQAEIRLNSLERRLQNNNELKEIYYEQMLDYIKKGQVEVAPIEETPGATFYLPHQEVKKEKLGKTKWRIVFDASSHEASASSLNEALEMGPNLLPEIFAILLRFRLHPIAIISDITQAFLQLVLDEKDRDMTRFLWYEVTKDTEGHHQTDGKITTYRFTRLPFGLTCSPFLLSAVVREHATKYQMDFPIAAPLIDDNMFMDDFAACVKSENDVIALYYELTSLMKLLSFPLSKWASNSEQLKAIWKVEGQKIETRVQVLGVDWNTDTDCFQMYLEEISRKIPDGPTTKRKLLQATAMFYDPLGLFSPVSIVAKMLFQETWCRGIGWDELLPPDLGSQWHTWASSLSSLSLMHVPRWLATAEANSSQVHVFCDASEKAYGAALYIHSTTEDCVLVRLACSKNRLAPVKKVTLPRLELLAALLGARLLHYFCNATGHDITQATLWTDSTVTLGWIRSDPNRWKTFICNRLTEIQRYTDPAQWRHCPGQDNPADHLTRGLTADHILHLDVWWHGPSWLTRPSNCWPSATSSTCQQLPEEKKKINHVLTTVTTYNLIDASKFSSYWKLIRTTAWVFRFLNNIRQRQRALGELTAAELSDARMHWVRVVQREAFARELQALTKHSPLPRDSKIASYNPFIDDGLLRLGGRLQFADLTRDEKHPMLLDGSHAFTRLLIHQTHVRLHHMGVQVVLAELRTEFWILRARQMIKKVLHRCLPCKISRKRRREEIEAPLPLDRVRPSRPFAVTGIDFAGPLYVKSGNALKKAYIVHFTCATVRAIHLELSTDLTTDRFLMAFQRFVGRRGVPHTIYSDNAQTFQAANRELQLAEVFTSPKTCQYLAHNNVTWKFIAPRAAWWGGWWERMIGSTKRCLRKVLGRSQVDEEGLNTVLVSIEATLNSRPIVKDGSNKEVLTPSHFLNGQKLTNLPTGPEPENKKDLTKEFRAKTKMVEDFWRRWKKEYLLQLRNYHEVKSPTCKGPRLRVGDVALLQEDVLPSHMWKRALVEELLQGRDGRVRTSILRLPDGSRISRPVQLVIPLEIDQGGEDVEG